MFEFNGNTYLSQNDRDMAEINYLQTELAYAKQKMEIIESNLAFANSQAESAQARVTSLTATLAEANQRIHDEMDKGINAEETIRKAREMFEEILAGDLNAKQTFEDFEEPLTLLGVKATREVSVEISVTWRGTIELPLGVEVDDLDIDDFGISIDGHSEYDSDISQYFEDSSIEER